MNILLRAVLLVASAVAALSTLEVLFRMHILGYGFKGTSSFDVANPVMLASVITLCSLVIPSACVGTFFLGSGMKWSDSMLRIRRHLSEEVAVVNMLVPWLAFVFVPPDIDVAIDIGLAGFRAAPYLAVGVAQTLINLWHVSLIKQRMGEEGMDFPLSRGEQSGVI